MFSINQSLFLQKTKLSYPNPKYLFGIGIWIWAAKNWGFSHRVSVVRVYTYITVGLESCLKQGHLYILRGPWLKLLYKCTFWLKQICNTTKKYVNWLNLVVQFVVWQEKWRFCIAVPFFFFDFFLAFSGSIADQPYFEYTFANQNLS